MRAWSGEWLRFWPAARLVVLLGLAGGSVGATEMLVNGSFESWGGGVTVDHGHSLSGGDGTYDGANTTSWSTEWNSLRTYTALGQAVQWVRMDEYNRTAGPAAAPMVAPGTPENTGSFIDNNYLPMEGMAGWSVFGDIDVKAGYFNPQDATTFNSLNVSDRISLDLSCTRGGGVQQTFAAVAGRIYTVSFDMSANMYGGVFPRDMLVQVGTGLKSVYASLDGPDGTNGSFVPLSTGSYSGVRADTVALAAGGGSGGTRVSYTALNLASGSVNNATVTDGWGTSRTIGSNILATDDSGGLAGLQFWFDVQGTAGSGLGSTITSANPAWTRVSFNFTAPATQTMTLLFTSLEGGNPGANWGPAIDDVSLVPEPGSLALWGVAAGLALRRRRRR